MEVLDVAIVGGGPAGLSCAIEAGKRGLTSVVLDKGAVVDAIRRFPHALTFFSTPELLELGGIPFPSSGFRPTRVETLRYYQSVVRFFNLPVRTGEEVRAIRKAGATFEVVTSGQTFLARNVIVATGYFDTPNPFDVPGAHLPKVHRYYSEPFAYTGREVAVVGGKNSAVEIALDLFRHGAHVSLVHRGTALSDGVKYWVLPDIENRIKNGEIKAYFGTEVGEIQPNTIVLKGRHKEEIPNDVLFVMIGYRPDNHLLEQVGVRIDPETLAPLHDSESMETNVMGLFVAGSIAAGKLNNKIFIENGRLHGKQIMEAIEKAR